MGLTRPTGEYVDHMVGPGGWPEASEDLLYDRAEELTGVLQQVTDALETCLRQQGEIFDGGIWSGGAASAAGTEFQTRIDGLVTLREGLETAINWHRYVAGSIEQAKSDICDNVDNANRQITSLAQDSDLDDSERTTAIEQVVRAAHRANGRVVEQTAEQIRASKTWRPSRPALPNLDDPKRPSPIVLPDVPATPGDDDDHRHRPPTPVIPPVSPITPAVPPVSPITPEPTPSPVAPIRPVSPSVPGGNPSPTPPPAPASEPAGPGPRTPGAAPPPAPAATAQPSPRGRGVAPASVSLASAAAPKHRTDDSASAAATPSAPVMPGAPMSPSAPGAGSGAGGKGVRPAVASQPSAPNAAARPAPRRTAAPAPAPTREDQPIMVPPIPVSAARAERDAVAEAAAPESVRRRDDPLRLARRIAAALNAPRAPGRRFMGFFWLTGVTTDGTIVVANSYALAFIPEGVALPEQVVMASADDAIPAAERARWATEPLRALQSWTAHHSKTLRAVIATAEQFAGSDPGTSKVVLEPDDIPDSGDMTGRSRLQVVDVGAAELLASTPDTGLAGLLPPAPAGAAPDRSRELWVEVMTPVAMRSANSQAEHLKAFQAYAAACRESCSAGAHAAGDPEALRAAVADWMYWKHVAGLMDSALAAAE